MPVHRRLPQGRCGLKYLSHGSSHLPGSSPSARKVWIEIPIRVPPFIISYRRLPQGRCGLKFPRCASPVCPIASPSARKVWIEIIQMSLPALFPASPSARKVWIEIRQRYQVFPESPSPSARKVWIEIIGSNTRKKWLKVAFRKEGVD